MSNDKQKPITVTADSHLTNTHWNKTAEGKNNWSLYNETR